MYSCVQFPRPDPLPTRISLSFSRLSLWSQDLRFLKDNLTNREAKKPLSRLAFSVSFVNRSSATFSSETIFSLLLLLLSYLYRPFLLPFLSLVRFIIRCALTLLSASLCVQIVTVYSSWLTCFCFHLLYTFFFLPLSLVMNSFIYAGLLLLLLDFLLMGLDHC